MCFFNIYGVIAYEIFNIYINAHVLGRLIFELYYLNSNFNVHNLVI